MKELNLQFNFTARYFKLGEINQQTKQVWFVLHGYGQLAKYFLKKFNILTSYDICVIAPEGLSHFYLENIETRNATGNNRVGATWMTRENREMDIENYIAYLQTVYEIELSTLESPPPITFLGFSQGAATVSRWALSGKPAFDRFILWAGIFPPDMNFEAGHEILKSKDLIAVYGDQDPFLTQERKEEMKQLSAKLGLTPRIIKFDGKHEINEDILKTLAN